MAATTSCGATTTAPDRLAGTANGTFSPSPRPSDHVPTDWHVVGTGDFNGDGRDDILWRNDSGQLTDWLRTANGSFLSNVFSVYVPTDWSVAATGDFNGDGYTDVLWRQDTGQLTDWLGSASGGLIDNGEPLLDLVPPTGRWSAPATSMAIPVDDILWREAMASSPNGSAPPTAASPTIRSTPRPSSRTIGM